MPEPTSATPEADKPSAPSTKPDTDPNASRRGDGEQRSFQPAEAARQAADTGKMAVHGAAQSGQRMVEAGRQSSSEVADFFRTSIDSMAALQAEMRQMFDEAWRRATGFGLRSPMMTAQPFAARTPTFLGQPAADVREGEDCYCIAVELPGLKREDVDVSMRDSLLTICGHKTDETEQTAGTFHLSERRFGRFERSFTIPQDVDRNGIEASFREGVLKVRLPRHAEAAKPNRRIEVKPA